MCFVTRAQESFPPAHAPPNLGARGGKVQSVLPPQIMEVQLQEVLLVSKLEHFLPSFNAHLPSGTAA